MKNKLPTQFDAEATLAEIHKADGGFTKLATGERPCPVCGSSERIVKMGGLICGECLVILVGAHTPEYREDRSE